MPGVSYTIICLLGSLTAGDRYDEVGAFKLTPEDINMLSEDLRNTLIPFEQVKITGDLGEGKKCFNSSLCVMRTQ